MLGLGLFGTFPAMPVGTIGNCFVSSDLTLQSFVKDKGQLTLFCNYFLLNWGAVVRVQEGWNVDQEAGRVGSQAFLRSQTIIIFGSLGVSN